jgi:hypothetical protein
VGLDHTVSPGGENREVGGLGVRCGAVQDVAAKPSDTDQERPQRCRVGSAPAAEPGDRPPRYTGRLDDYAFWERLERWTDELGADPASAMVVGGGDVVGSEQAGREFLDLVGFFANVSDDEVADGTAVEQALGLPGASHAVGVEALGFTFPAAEGDYVTEAPDADGRASRELVG